MNRLLFIPGARVSFNFPFRLSFFFLLLSVLKACYTKARATTVEDQMGAKRVKLLHGEKEEALRSSVVIVLPAYPDGQSRASCLNKQETRLN